MRLKSFHVRVFRNVIDSGDIEVDDVTCLVGKNEAGKSAILEALHTLNPAKPPAILDLLDEYPRWLKKEHEISGIIGDATPIEADFELSASEVAEIAERFGEAVLSSPIVKASRKYGQTSLKVEASLDYQRFVDLFSEGLSERLKNALGSPATSDELRAQLKSLVDIEESASAAKRAVASDAQEAMSRLDATLGENQNLLVAISALLRSRIPKTFYFSTYSQLVGRYNLEDVFAAVKNGSDDDEELQAAADFLELARVVPETIEDWDFEASNAELESISSLLTKRVKDHWKQNDHLRLRVTLESLPVEVSGVQQLKRFLQFRVEDSRHDFSNRLDRRSTGFRWFVSFIASFLEFEQDRNLILLLDEPGLSLHARAQMDLLDTIERDLAANRQVLYSTHSPFMVRTNALSRARIVEDQGPERGSAVINDAGVVADADTLFPLQAALGYDVVQSLFIGNRNILVEGISDFIYLTMISDHLKSLGRSALPDDCRLLPAGGATNIPTFIALLGTQLEIVVLVDGNSNRQRIENSIKQGRLDAARVLSLDSFSTVPGADIEDLFTASEYLVFYNGTFAKTLKASALSGTDRIVQRIARSEGEFNHGEVAAHFLRNLNRSIGSLSPATLDRFENLITSLVAALPSV